MGATRVKPTNPRLRRGRDTSRIYAAWPLAHRSTAPADYAGSNALSFNGTATITPAGFDGPCASLPGGSANFLFTSNSVFDPAGGDFTALVWLMLTATASQTILNNNNGTGTGSAWLSTTAANVLRTNLGGTLLTSSGTATAGTPHLVGITLQGTTLQIWLDGVSVLSNTITPVSNVGILRIGANSAGGSTMTGQVSAVELYQRALGAAEWQRRYNQFWRNWTPRKRWAMTSYQTPAGGAFFRRNRTLRVGSRGAA